MNDASMRSETDPAQRATSIEALVKFGKTHPKVRLAVGEVTALLVAAAGGWVWAALGKRGNRRALRAAELRNDLLEGHNLLLDARLNVFALNFGNASRNFEDAKWQVRRAEAQLKAGGRSDDATYLGLALTTIDEAQRMAGQLDQGANSRAGEAARMVADVLDANAKR